MSTSKKKVLLNTVSVKLGCGSCRRLKLTNIFNPKPKPKNPTYQKHKLYNNHYSSSSSGPWNEDKYDTSSTTNTTNTTNTNTATTFSPLYSSNLSDSETYAKDQRRVGGLGRGGGGEGVAVEKDSEDPYLDFRHSMLQMILENEIYSKDDLRELLNCFLQLNAPYHHGVIVRAFTEIWNGVSDKRGSSHRVHTNRTRKPRGY